MYLQMLLDLDHTCNSWNWRKPETAKHSALQHRTLTANQQNSTARQLRLVHKNTQDIELESKNDTRKAK